MPFHAKHFRASCVVSFENVPNVGMTLEYIIPIRLLIEMQPIVILRCGNDNQTVWVIIIIEINLRTMISVVWVAS